MTLCPSRDELEQLLAGRLETARSMGLEEHLESCASCRELVESLLDDKQLRVWRAALEDEDSGDALGPSVDLVQRLKRVPEFPAGGEGAGTEGEMPGFQCTQARGVLEKSGYSDIEKLGEGSSGVVFRARGELRRLVAVKVLKPDAAGDEQRSLRFEREAQAAASVSSDYVVAIYQVKARPQVALPYIEMEYIVGESLRDRFDRKDRPDFAEAADIARQGALGLHAAHERGIVHRDVKPSNIMLERGSGRAKVSDFGLARVMEGDLGSLSSSGQILGSLPYLSPEHISMPAGVDKRSDVYGLGVVLYEMLTGERPFRGMGHSLLLQIMREDPEPPRKLDDTIPKDLETITMKCLAKKPTNRYQTARDLAADLERWLSDEPIQARPERLLEKLRRKAKRHPWRAAGVTLAVVVPSASIVAAILVGRAWLSEAQAHAASEQAKRLAVQRGELALEAYDTLVFQLQDICENVPLSQGVRQRLLETAIEGLAKIEEIPEDVSSPDHSLAAAHQRRGDLFLMAGRTEKARDEYERCREAASAGVGDPRYPSAKRDLSVGSEKLGDASMRMGKTADAGIYYAECLGLRRQLLKDDPRSVQARRDLAVALEKSGDANVETGRLSVALEQYVESFEAFAALAKEQPSDANARRSLAMSYQKLGDVKLQLGDIPGALTCFKECFDIRKELAVADEESVESKRELALSQERLGAVSLKLGDLGTSRECFEEAADLRRELWECDKQNSRAKRDLFVAYVNLGDVSAQSGDVEEAEKWYGLSLELADELAAADDQDAEVRRDVVVACNKLGHLRVQSEASKAQEWYAKGLEGAEELLASDPENAGAKRDVATSYDNMGNVCRRLGDKKAAREYYVKALKLREELVDIDPQNVRSQLDLSVSYGKLAIIAGEEFRHQEAVTWYEKALDVLCGLRDEGRLDGNREPLERIPRLERARDNQKEQAVKADKS